MNEEEQIFQELSKMKITRAVLQKLMPFYEEEGLTDNQAKFVFYYVRTWFNRQAAYRLTFPKKAERLEKHKVNTLSYQIAKNPKVARVAKMFADQDISISKNVLENKIFDIWYNMATYLPSDIVDSDGALVDDIKNLPKGLQMCIKGISTKLHGDACMPIKTIEVQDRFRALQELAKYIKMTTDEVKVTHAVTPEVEKRLNGVFEKFREEIDNE